MPRSIPSYLPLPSQADDEDDEYQDDRSAAPVTVPSSPTDRRQSNPMAHERTSLLGPGSRDQVRRSYTGLSLMSRPDTFFRHNSASGTLRRSRHHSRMNSLNTRFGPDGSTHPFTLDADTAAAKDGMTGSSFLDERLWYDQFTSIDWVHDSTADGIRLRELRSRKDLRGRMSALFDSVQGWILVAVIGCITAVIAYFVDVTENTVYDLKEGFCATTWFASKKYCCDSDIACGAWQSWSQILQLSEPNQEWVDFAFFVIWAVGLAAAACALTLLTKTVVPSTISLSTLDENLAAETGAGNSSPSGYYSGLRSRPAMVYYSAAGSGVAEVKVILSGFVLHGYLGLKTLVFKTLALILAISSGLSLGKEGPYVHIASCVGNICCRIFPKYRNNDGKRREVLSASASSGVAVAFGAPIGAVLFGLEEVRYVNKPYIGPGSLCLHSRSLAITFRRRRFSEPSFVAL
jgi:chloride channel 3/4/5